MTLKKIFLIYFLLLSGCTSVNNNPKPEPVKKEIPQIRHMMLFAGDVMLDWGILDVINEQGIDYPIRNIKDFLKGFNYRFCNLECPISDKGEVNPDKKYVFRGKPEHIELLHSAGINGVSLANNHASDYGKTGLLDTMDNLSKNGISCAGAGKDLNAALAPIQITINNIKIAILAYATIAYEDSFATRDTPGVARAKIELIRENIKKYKASSDIVIISIHWGREYSEYPDPKDIKLAHDIIKSGADVIIGHHPHIFQGIEIYNGKPIFYSLGNFIFGSVNENAMENILVGMSFKQKKLSSFSVYPINGNGNSKKPFQYKILNGEHAISTLNKLVNISMHMGSQIKKNAVIQEDSLEYNF